MLGRKLTGFGIVVVGGATLFGPFFSYYTNLILQKIDPQGSVLLNYLPQIIGGALILVGLLIWFWPKIIHLFWGAEETEQIFNTSFANETVEIDEKGFHNCTFNNVTFGWRGGYYHFSNCQINGTVALNVRNRTGTELLQLLNFLSLLDESFAHTLKYIPPHEK